LTDKCYMLVQYMLWCFSDITILETEVQKIKNKEYTKIGDYYLTPCVANEVWNAFIKGTRT